jgi:glucose-6-phosphate 1-dehydrogenase
MFPIDRKNAPNRAMNEVVIDFADPGSITVRFLAKEPGPEMRLGASKIVFRYEDSFALANALDGYERLILLAMLGDQSLFTSSAGIERLWEISEPLLKNPPAVQSYPPGSWGPEPAIDRLISPYRWYLPEPD